MDNYDKSIAQVVTHLSTQLSVKNSSTTARPNFLILCFKNFNFDSSFFSLQTRKFGYLRYIFEVLTGKVEQIEMLGLL